MKKKIFIIDDHQLIREGLTQLINLEEDLAVVGEASDATEAMLGIQKTKPDLAVVDISLKGTSGIELTKNILVKYPGMFVLIISMHDESLYLERGFRAGARGYLTKQEATNNAVTAIRKVLSGEIYVSDKWRDKLAHKFVSGQMVTASSSLGMLTDRELEVLQLIGQGYSTQKIVDELQASVATVKSHYTDIKGKLDLKNADELSDFAMKWTPSEKNKIIEVIGS